MRAVLAVALAVTLLSGCGPTIYEKPGGTQEEFQRTFAGCRAQLAFLTNASPVTPRQFLQDCMRAQGWRVQQQPAQKSMDTPTR